MDEALTQFVSKEEFESFDQTFNALARSGQSLTRLPKKDFDRRRVIAAFDEAFELIGGVPRLAIWAHDNPTEFYRHYAKLMPASSQLELSGGLEFIIRPALPQSTLDD